MRSALSFRSYSFIIFGFCLLFLIFGYRSLRSNEGKRYYDDGDDGGSEYNLKSTEKKTETKGLAKLLKAKCAELTRIGEHTICSSQRLNEERKCLVFSVATRTELKFEMDITRRLDKCKVRVYDHEAKATDSDGRYEVVEKLDDERIDSNVLEKIVKAEPKGKIHLLRLEAGADGPKLAQTSLLKERSVCQLLLTLYKITNSELADFVEKMRKSFGYYLYSLRDLEVDTDIEEEEQEEEEDGKNWVDEEQRRKKKNKKKANKRNYTLGLISEK